MIRYLAIAAAIVLGIGMLSAAWFERDLIRIKLASVYARVAPKAERARTDRSANRPFIGLAPWALSALPDCFTQLAHVTGSRGYVAARLPKGARRVAAPATLSYGRCTISLAGVEATVTRGSDRFLIPPTVRLYRSADRVAIWRSDARGNDLRIYSTVPELP